MIYLNGVADHFSSKGINIYAVTNGMGHLEVLDNGPTVDCELKL